MVDAEPWTLIGLEENIQRESMGFEVIYKTSRRVEALQNILKENSQFEKLIA